jgi:SAM-dependent methyltransferase
VAPERDTLVDEQIAYYRARADEYDRMLMRERRYDVDGLDPASPDRDTRELAVVEARLNELGPFGDVLEMACGTGWWTKRLAKLARSVTAIDASPEMLRILRRRVRAAGVRVVRADVFDWTPDRAYDLVFFGFWLSHVPPDRFEEFWRVVRASLSPRGRVFFVDEMKWDGVEGYEEALGDDRGTTMRPLEDGRRFRMVKVYHRPPELQLRLSALGWSAKVSATGDRIYAGIAEARLEA